MNKQPFYHSVEFDGVIMNEDDLGDFRTMLEELPTVLNDSIDMDCGEILFTAIQDDCNFISDFIEAKYGMKAIVTCEPGDPADLM